MGNPSDSTPPPIVDKLCEATRDPRNHRYSVSKGVYNLRRDVSRHYQEKYGVELDPETEVIACIGSKEGISHLLLAMLGAARTARPASTATTRRAFSPLRARKTSASSSPR